MAKIDVYTNEMSTLAARLKSISSVIENAEQVAGRVQSNLDFEIAVRENIADALGRSKRQLQQQKDKVMKLSKLTATAEDEFRSADGKMDKSTKNIIGSIVAPIAVAALSGVPLLFAGAAIAHHNAITSYIRPEKKPLVFAGISLLASRMTEIVNNIKNLWGAKPKPNSTPTEVAGTADVPATNVNVSSQPYENLTPFSSNGYNTKGNYSDYSVLGGLKPEYCYNQQSAASSTFKAAGCFMAADACVASIAGRGIKNPEQTWENSGRVFKAYDTTRIKDSWKWTPEQIRSKAYEELKQGKPVVVRVQGSTKYDKDGKLIKDNGHSVVIVGLRNGADPNNLTDADFLIMDPDGGGIKALSERKANINDPSTALKSEQDDAGMRILK